MSSPSSAGCSAAGGDLQCLRQQVSDRQFAANFFAGLNLVPVLRTAVAPGSQLNWDVLLRESLEDTGCAGVEGFDGTETRAEFVQSGSALLWQWESLQQHAVFPPHGPGSNLALFFRRPQKSPDWEYSIYFVTDLLNVSYVFRVFF